MDCKPENNNSPTILPAAYKLTAMSTITIITVDYFCLGMGVSPRPHGGGNYHTTPSTETNLNKFNSWISQLPNGKYWWNNMASATIKKDIQTYSQYYGYSMDFVKQFVLQCMSTNYTLDLFRSLNSPFNVDTSTITDATPEGEKFNKIYEALKYSPEFKKLFLDMFEENKSRFNVKFEIADHVFEDNDPTKKEVNATTTYTNGNPNLVIKISKQILASSTSMSKTKIEIAKTIIHECIHAYLFVKKTNPDLGMDIVGLLNALYPTANEQHQFMYDHMLPTMSKVLLEIRDSVKITSFAARSEVESLTMHPTQTPLTSEPWNWSNYLKFLSLKGLESTPCFQQDFPNPSNQLTFFNDYIVAGHTYLDKP